MSYKNHANGNVGEVASGHLPATTQANAFALQPGQPERRAWRKRRRIRLSRAAGLRGD